MDVLGHAIHDYYYNLSPGKLLIHNKFGKPDVMPAHLYFRDETEMPLLELTALQLCKSRVLDVGAGAGSHALYLQQQNFDVTAVDVSPMACHVMRKRGVLQVQHAEILALKNDSLFDTVLLLMNGIGLAANVDGLRQLLAKLGSLLAPGGQVLFDSSDVAYLYRRNIPPMKRYYGEIEFRYEYKQQKTSWFTWLYIDMQKMEAIAHEAGWRMEVMFEDDHDQYLARLTRV